MTAAIVVLASACSQTPTGSNGDPPSPPPAPEGLGGFGVLGDSNADEYRADDDRGGAYAATTLNWVELLRQRRGVDFGEWGSRPEPRRSGYAYNWARSGATAATLVASGQHTGLAAQIEAGIVSNVAIDIGTNDFNTDAYERIYDGSLSGEALDRKIDDFIGHVTEAVDTILASGSPRIILALVADRGLDPSFAVGFPDPQGRARATGAVEETNARLRALGDARGFPTWDPNALGQDLVARIDAQGRLGVGGELIDILERGAEPHHARLDDGAGHMGTVMAGFYANAFIIESLSDHHGIGIEPLSDSEILAAAGID